MNPVRDNKLQTRNDFARAAVQMLEPLLPYMSEGRALIRLGDTGAAYTDRIAQMEAFARPLWAIVPMLAGKCPEVEPFWALWREGIEHGVDPKHPEYWGKIGPYDQRMVEMAVMGVGLCLVPDRFLGDLSEAGRKNLHRWLSQINLHEMPLNNWAFFRVLVNIGFMLNGLTYDANRLLTDLALIDSHYEDHGWYHDYPTQRDYYTPWGFHYYGLVYAHAMQEKDPERAETFRARARAYAEWFAAWFAEDGSGLPYGRSLTYRFAQGAFFSALGLAEAESAAIGYGKMKHLMLQNFRWWMHRPVFTDSGILSIGYAYPNLNMAEGYNAPGSPYWSMKTFIALALPEGHAFWQAEEKAYMPPERLLDRHARMLIVRDAQNWQVQAFTAGNHAPEHEHTDAKYEKFVYSTLFGFSVPRGTHGLRQGAFDNMLALSEDGANWHVRYGCQKYAIEENRVVSVWKPFRDVTVRTEIIPLGNDWHIRRHSVSTPRPLRIAEGGFAISREEENVLAQPEVDGLAARVNTPWGTSGIIGFSGYEQAEMVRPEANTNMMAARTLLPTLTGTVDPGETELTCAVLGAVIEGEAKWANPPSEPDTP